MNVRVHGGSPEAPPDESKGPLGPTITGKVRRVSPVQDLGAGTNRQLGESLPGSG